MKKITILNKTYEINPIEIDNNFADIVESINDMSMCDNCPLQKLPFNKEVITATGYPRARIMFVAMNPSNKRELSGHRNGGVFGKADNINHDIMKRMLTSVNLTFNNVYITNIQKCSTENNKLDYDVLPKCIERKFAEELAFVDPELIICLGNEVSKIFGIDKFDERVYTNGDYKIATAYHPSYYSRKGGEGADGNLTHLWREINEIITKDFVNLHVHNEFSIRDGIGTVEEHVLWALKHKTPAVSITNHGNISVFFKQYEACKRVGIKPIFGAELYIIPDRSKLIPWIKNEAEGAVEKRKEFGGPRHHILVLAKNYTGLKNLFKITSLAFIESFYKFPLIDFQLLAENKEGIIISTACAGSELNKYLANDQYDEAKEFVTKYKNEFGDDFYIEMMSMDYPVQWMLNTKLWKLAKEMDVKTIITTDAHYPYPEDEKVHEAILLLQSKKSYKNGDSNKEPEELEEEEVLESENEKLWEFTVKDLYLKTERQIMIDFAEGRWFDYSGTEDGGMGREGRNPEILKTVLKNTYEVFTKIENFELDQSIKIPKLYEDGAEVLKQKIAHGLKTRPFDRERLDEYKKRCRREYDIIVKMGFVDYFLILEDMIRWTKTNFGRYSVGPARGSAGGSLVNYLLEITDIDPITHNLLFERFLDEGRRDMPDVDIDFQPDIRDNVKQYLVDKYGQDKVAAICNYQVAKVKSSIKDAARIYNLDFAEVNTVTNALPFFIYVDGKKDVIDNMSYEYIVEHYPTLLQFFKNHPEVDRLFKRLRNSIKAIGRHAAGLVVSSVTLYDWIPLIRAKEHIVTANTEGGDYHELTAQGFVKFDILGLNNLAVVNDTMKLVKERHNFDIDWDKISLESPEAYILAKRGDTIGVFQFESNLATRTTIDVQPDCFDDLSAINAIIRPGPLDMGMHQTFAQRKKSNNWKDQIHPSYRDLVKATYGIIVYQEDFMRIFREIGHFDAIEVNNARKDLVKYERSTRSETARLKRVDGWKDKFVTNAKKVMPDDEAEKLWELIRAFARYGFNKSHADAYTITSFRELWLKAHYGLEFYTALLNNTFRAKEDKYGTSTVAKYISHIQTNPVYQATDTGKFERIPKVRILAADVNRSSFQFAIEDDKDIRFGLSCIKGVTPEAADEIIKNRPFKSIDDFIDSDIKVLKNKRVIRALIQAGAFDSISENRTRSDMYNHFIAKRKYKEDPVIWDVPELIENEVEVMNVSFTEVDYFTRLRNAIKEKFGEKLILGAVEDVVDMENEKYVNCLFRITRVEKKKTKKGKKYYVLSISDGISMLTRIYYWAHKEENPINVESKKVMNDVYAGTFGRQNNFYNLKNAKFVKSMSS
jgi:DNA polymerase-3 subunit alpha